MDDGEVEVAWRDIVRTLELGAPGSRTPVRSNLLRRVAVALARHCTHPANAHWLATLPGRSK
jgi:hypothetical protein